MTKSHIQWWRSALIIAYTLIGVGCNLSDTGLSAYRPPDEFFAKITLEHHAINLSMAPPYDTVTLHTTGIMGDGSVVPGDVTYSVSSPSLSVTNGVLKAESPVARAILRVTLTHGTVTRTDSAIVSVIVSAPDRLREFGLRIPTGDSAKTAVGANNKMIPLIRESGSGADLSTLLVQLMSSDTTVARLVQSGSNIRILPVRPGRVVLYTSTFAFGAAWRDSLIFTVGWPLQFYAPSVERYVTGSSIPLLDFRYPNITMGVGSCVLWINVNYEVDIDLQFDDSAHVVAPMGYACAQLVKDPSVGGNIAPWRRIAYDGNPENMMTAQYSPYRARVFSSPGEYTYRSTLHGTGGFVRVCDEHNDTTCAPLRMGGWY